MKLSKGTKTAAVVFAAIFLILTISVLLVTPVTKNYILSHDKELIGRKMLIGDMSVNVLTGNISVDNFEIKEADDSTSFLSLNHFQANVSPWRLIGKEVIIKDILFDSLSVVFIQNKEYMNINDMISFFSSDSTESTTTSSSGWGVGLYNFSINRSDILYQDLDIGSKWIMDEIKMTIPDVYFGKSEKTGIGINLIFPDGGVLHTSTTIDSLRNYNLSINLKDFELSGTKPYLQQIFRVTRFSGLLDANVNVYGNIEHLLDFKVDGRVAGKKLVLDDKFGKDILAADTALFVFDKVDFASQTYLLDTLYASGVKSYLSLFANDGNNFSSLIIGDDNETIGENSTSTTDSLPYVVRIGYADINRSRFEFTDSTMTDPFSYLLSSISLRCDNFDLNGKNNIYASASLGSKGKVKVGFKGKVYDINNMDLSLSMDHVSLVDFTPYTLHYFAYPILNGTFSFNSQNVISSGNLQGVNKLDVFQSKAGKKDKSRKPLYNVPLRLGLYVLNDKDQHITIDLPVSGTISSPEFSYKKIILKTISNLFLKIAASPYKFFAKSGEDIQSFEFEILKDNISLDSYSIIDKLVDAVSSKPELKLGLTQYYNYNSALEVAAVYILKQQYYLSRHPEMQNDMLTREKISAMDSKDASLTLFADSLLGVRLLSTEGNIQEKSERLFKNEAFKEITTCSDSRCRKISEYMTESKHLSDTSFSISVAPVDSLIKYTGGDIYKVSLTMPED